MSRLAALLSQKSMPAEWTRRLQTDLRTGRQLVEQRRRTPEEEVFATATPLDGLLDGGLRRGTMTELVGWGSSGRFSLVLGVLAAVTSRGEVAALIDLGDALDPRLAEAAGIELSRLLWARPQRLKEALAAVEAILEAGLPMVVLDLGVPPVPGGRGVEAFWLRIARAAQARRSALLVSSPYRVSGTATHAVVEAKDRRSGWQGRGAEPRLLAGLRSCLGLVKGPGWREGRAEELTLHPPAPIARLPEESEKTENATLQPPASLAEIRLWRPRRGDVGRSKKTTRPVEPPPDPLMARGQRRKPRKTTQLRPVAPP
ncbi:MAG: DNA recombination/repair protein RecA [Thermoanaerobaculia bacterium]|nr:DNA recombination/repair protein RecA [Thermoanaerobaculia bacterium]